MPKWTTAQENAISARNRNILVSAAAGSGKTTVLAERVKRIITDKDNPVNLDELLIVTFTRAAAAEMKSRISKKLSECIANNPDDPFYKKQLSQLPTAKICTIDSFCADLVRQNFYELGIRQDFNILDESQLIVLQNEIINKVLDEEYESGDESFIALVNTFTQPGQEKDLIEAINKTIRYIYSQPFPYVWLDDALEKLNPSIPFCETEWYKYINEQIEELADYAIELVNRNLAIVPECGEKADKYLETFELDLDIFVQIKNTVSSSWNEALQLKDTKFPKLPATTKLDPWVADEIKKNRKLYKEKLFKSITSFFISSEEEYTEDVTAIYPILLKFSNLIKKIDQLTLDKKLERNTFSFADIEHFAISLLFERDENGNIVKKDLAETLSEKYHEILVDEYQDTNEAQDLLFTYLSNGKNLFTVGDIKQSIYRFRLAMPSIFNSRKKRYPLYNYDDNEESSKIILDRNFRSRREICSYVNFIFSAIMSEKVGELDYTSEEYLNYGANYPQTENPCVSIQIVDGNSGRDKDKIEGDCIAKYILQKVQSGELINGDDGKPRPVTFGDFSILLRSAKGRIGDFAEALTKYGIPVVCDNSTNLFENAEISLLISALKTIDNPTNDIALLATMMSPFYGFSADDLTRIKMNQQGKRLHNAVFASDDERAIAFVQELKELKRISVTMTVSSFIRYLVEYKGMIAYINALGNGELRYQNILSFINYAKGFDSGTGVGLTAFLRYINKIIESDKSVDSATITASDGNAVTIMTVHHSKGLEFPICIYAGASRMYNTFELRDKLVINSEFGLAIKHHNEQSMAQYKTIPYLVNAHKNEFEIMSENLRVLYVAITRAKEQFVTFASYENIAATVSNLQLHIVDGKINPYSVNKINNDADLLLLCALLHKDGDVLRDLVAPEYFTESINYLNLKPSDFDMSINVIDVKESEEQEHTFKFVDYSGYQVEQIAEKLTYKYDRLELSGLAGKLTASSLDDVEGDFEYITSAKPAFMKGDKLSSSEKGTAMHEFMHYCDYSEAHNNLDGEIQRLVNEKLLTKEQADSLNKNSLQIFFSSDFAQRMFNSSNLYREIKVSDFITASSIYSTRFDDEILVQGIADCVFEENGELVLVDYKTDRIKDENELLSKYKKQVNFYKNAIEKTLKLPVKETVLYSFSLNKVCYYK